MKLTLRERSTVLAALRLWQEQEAQAPVMPLEDFGEGEPLLSDMEIDDLCQRLNFEID